ncbi:MAG TPA: hypothetical protein VI584_06755 [Nitrospiria bacterium]|nr:hypothetical protein [Nitrospiria bacterium]
MKVTSILKDKHLRLPQEKIDKVKQILSAKTETEAIETALDIILAEERINRAMLKVGGQVKIKQVFE